MTPEEWAKSVVDRLPELVQYKNRLTLVTDVVAAAQQEARAAALEEAAKRCDGRSRGHPEASAAGLEATKCANAIRALLEGRHD